MSNKKITIEVLFIIIVAIIMVVAFTTLIAEMGQERQAVTGQLIMTYSIDGQRHEVRRMMDPSQDRVCYIVDGTSIDCSWRPQ